MFATISLLVLVVLTGNLVSSRTVSSQEASELPVVIKTVRPPYPARAMADKISGTVLVDVRVNPDGTVAEARIVMGPEIFRNNVKAAARFWRFKPLTCDIGSYVVRLTFIFHERSYVAPAKKTDFMSPYQMEISLPEAQF
jgi:TonB family protein